MAETGSDTLYPKHGALPDPFGPDPNRPRGPAPTPFEFELDPNRPRGPIPTPLPPPAEYEREDGLEDDRR